MNHRQPPNAVFEMWQGRVIRRPFRDVVRRYFVAGACSSVTRLARQGVRASDRIAGTLAMGGDRALDTVTWAVEVAADTVDGVAATVGGAAARNTLRHFECARLVPTISPYQREFSALWTSVRRRCHPRSGSSSHLGPLMKQP